MPTVFYVSPNGAGTADGSSVANAAPASMLPQLIGGAGPDGQVLLVADQGAYKLTGSPIIVTGGGTDGHPVTVRGIDSQGNTMRAEFVGTRADPFDPSGAQGEQAFRLINGADNLNFADMTFTNVGYGAFRVGGDIRNLTIEHMDATNIQRFFEDYSSGNNDSATITGLTIRDIDVAGYSRGVVRIAYDSSNILIEDVHGDSQRQDEAGSPFAIGVHIDGSAHDIVIRNSSMRNAEDRLNGTFWNGDGFATEGGAYNVLFENTVSTGNVDAGYDIKSASTVLSNAVAEDNGRNFRVWATDTTLTNITSIEPNLRGGNSSQNDVWFGRGAKATVNNAVFSDSTSNSAVSSSEGQAVATFNDLVALLGPTVNLLKTASKSVVTFNGTDRGTAVTTGVSYAEATAGVALYADDDTNHSITGGHGNDVLRGGAGSDVLAGGEGYDRLIGGAGDDKLIGGAGPDVLLGGAGFDIADYSQSLAAVQVDLGGAAPTGGDAAGDLLDGIEALIGSAFADILIGDDAANLLVGGGGGDTLLGGKGDDLLVGGAGADKLIGGAGIDTADYSASASGVTVDLTTGRGSGGDAEGDRLEGIEVIRGSALADRLIGGSGGVTFIAGAGADTMIGGSGLDTVDYSGNATGVVLDLGAGTSSGGDANGDVLTGIDAVVGSAFADRITGDGLSNQLFGGAGDDILDGAGGNDLLVGGAGADRLIGGSGFDTVDYSRNTTAVAASLSTGIASGGDADRDTLSGIEALVGSAFGDTLTGDAAANRLDGGAGDDGLIGGAGADILIGGLGTDIADYSTATAAVQLDLTNGTGTGDAAGDVLDGIEVVVGTRFNDILVAGGTVTRLEGGVGDDRLIGTGAAETFVGGEGADTIAGGDGIDTVDFSAAKSAVSVNLARGTGLAGEAKGDTYTSIERVVGSGFGDTLVAAAGGSVLVGGGGADKLTGGSGVDTADYSTSSAAVTVNLATGVGSGGDADGDALSGIEVLVGSAFADSLTGDDRDNRLVGGLGADVLVGGGGGDTADYSTSLKGMTVNLTSGTASDGDTLSAIENVIGSAFGDTLTGDGTANRLIGGYGVDVLDGAGGADVMVGGLGDDTYFVDNAGDVVVEMAGEGDDRVNATLSTYTLGADVERLAYTGTGSFIGYGNALENVFYGSTGSETFYGYEGDDNFQGSLGADIFYGGAGSNSVDFSKSKTAITVNLLTQVNVGGDADGDRLYDVHTLSGSNYADSLTGDDNDNTLYGRGGIDVLYGRGGNDKLDGGEGADAMYGGLGDDLYIVDDANDQTIEDENGGYDRVAVMFDNWTLGANLEALQTSTVRSFTGTGNALDNSITGNSNADRLYGLGGNDTLNGKGGADFLYGGEGSDTASYADSLIGVSVDLATGLARGGDAEGDTLSDIENLTGSAFADALGGLATGSRLTGLAGNDTLRGAASADLLIGGAGDDALDGGTGFDIAQYGGARGDYAISFTGGVLSIRDLREGSPDGTDTLKNIEQLQFLGSQPKPLPIIEGTAGSDKIAGTAGIVDTFFYDTALGLALGTDQIKNFGAGDRIVTTSAFIPTDANGRVRSNNSVSYVLPGAADAGTSQSDGSIKIYSEANKAISSLSLLGTQINGGITYYIYGALGDTTAKPTLDFGPTSVPPATYTGTEGADNFTAPTSGVWTILGLGGNDVLAGASGQDHLLGGDADDRLTGAGGDDVLDGGAGTDTAVLSGERGDYIFSISDGMIVVRDLQAGSPDGTDSWAGIEQAVFLGGNHRPVGAIDANLTHSMTGTDRVDTFLFDTALGLGLGADQIRSFGQGDRLVTTSKFYDSDNDGKLRANASDKFVLPGTVSGLADESTGTVKLLGAGNKPITRIELVGSVVDHGVAYYVYGATGDTAADADLYFT